MYQHHIEDMTEAICEEINKFEKKDQLSQAINKEVFESVLQKYWKDKIAIVWTVEDVQHRVAEDFSDRGELTDQEAISVLEDILNNHNAEFGVAWDTFDAYIHNYLTAKGL